MRLIIKNQLSYNLEAEEQTMQCPDPLRLHKLVSCYDMIMSDQRPESL